MKYHATIYRNNKLNDDAGAKIKIFKQIDIYVGRNRTAICQYSKDYDPSELWH